MKIEYPVRKERVVLVKGAEREVWSTMKLLIVEKQISTLEAKKAIDYTLNNLAEKIAADEVSDALNTGAYIAHDSYQRELAEKDVVIRELVEELSEMLIQPQDGMYQCISCLREHFNLEDFEHEEDCRGNNLIAQHSKKEAGTNQNEEVEG